MHVIRVPARHTRVPSRHESAFIDAFDAHADALFRHACMRIADRERARELTQDAFIKAWDYVAAGHEIGQWKSFLYRVLNNLIIDEYRRAKDLSLDALAETDPTLAGTLVTTGDRAALETALDDARALERVRALIKEMPDPYRTALILRYVDGLAPKEIAEALGESENAVSVRIHRAVGKLRELCRAHGVL
jgi:RNA polymerase sigma-70 factor (ECF subfamily)